jgi:hypothetical protein
MTVVVRITVHHNKAMLAEIKQEIFSCPLSLGLALVFAKNALMAGSGLFNEGHPPRRN